MFDQDEQPLDLKWTDWAPNVDKGWTSECCVCPETQHLEAQRWHKLRVPGWRARVIVADYAGVQSVTVEGWAEKWQWRPTKDMALGAAARRASELREPCKYRAAGGNLCQWCGGTLADEDHADFCPLQTGLFPVRPCEWFSEHACVRCRTRFRVGESYHRVRAPVTSPNVIRQAQQFGVEPEELTLFEACCSDCAITSELLEAVPSE